MGTGTEGGLDLAVYLLGGKGTLRVRQGETAPCAHSLVQWYTGWGQKGGMPQPARCGEWVANKGWGPQEGQHEAAVISVLNGKEGVRRRLEHGGAGRGRVLRRPGPIRGV